MSDIEKLEQKIMELRNRLDSITQYGVRSFQVEYVENLRSAITTAERQLEKMRQNTNVGAPAAGKRRRRTKKRKTKRSRLL